MATCKNCNKEFTQEDKDNANWREFLGDYYHRRCPGTFHICDFCSEEIRDDQGQEAVRVPGGYIHKGCTWTPGGPIEANPSSWIVKKRTS